MKLRAGDWVEVRSKEEILNSLDKHGMLEGMPFMPQMFQYCGQRFKVYKRAHKTCDTVNPIAGRRIADAIHLDLRCDGAAYGGCQAACLIFWKGAWLKQVEVAEAADSHIDVSGGNHKTNALAGCSESDVWSGTHVQNRKADDALIYTCQATQLPDYTRPLRWWDARQYVEDYTSGNVTLGELFRGFVYLSYYHFTFARREKWGLGRPARWLYDRIQALRGGVPFPRRLGTVPPGQTTPTTSLNLQPGELVRIKSYEEILATLDKRLMNRGMLFDAELVPFCGKEYRVKTRVERFIDEKSGRLLTMKTPGLILENVWCLSRYSNCRMFCPRSIYSWWREIWLERVLEQNGR